MAFLLPCKRIELQHYTNSAPIIKIYSRICSKNREIRLPIQEVVCGVWRVTCDCRSRLTLASHASRERGQVLKCGCGISEFKEQAQYRHVNIVDLAVILLTSPPYISASKLPANTPWHPAGRRSQPTSYRRVAMEDENEKVNRATKHVKCLMYTSTNDVFIYLWGRLVRDVKWKCGSPRLTGRHVNILNL